jgi:hypothetical protein
MRSATIADAMSGVATEIIDAAVTITVATADSVEIAASATMAVNATVAVAKTASRLVAKHRRPRQRLKTTSVNVRAPTTVATRATMHGACVAMTASVNASGRNAMAARASKAIAHAAVAKIAPRAIAHGAT